MQVTQCQIPISYFSECRIGNPHTTQPLEENPSQTETRSIFIFLVNLSRQADFSLAPRSEKIKDGEARKAWNPKSVTPLLCSVF